MSDLTEEQVIQACREGDLSSYGWLIERYSRAVFGICLGLLSNLSDAEDLCQEAMVKGMLEIRHLRSGDRFKPWIFRIARNMCIDFLRRRKLGQQVLVKVQEQQELEKPEKNEFFMLEKAIGLLPEKFRLPLMLYYFQDLSSEAVAETMGITPAGVNSRLSRARKLLRDILRQQK
ncbi:MAG: RNA polymerase sigma factor [Phycisphaerae bacterium]|nr:RNA polymerase sigma factor [Phycisphaerae bacterium]